jgi:DNA topoisomerase-1
MFFYKPYVNLEYNQLPQLNQGDRLKNLGIEVKEKFTQPPQRYNQASLLGKMEQEQIGTKATRAQIIATLFKRNYIVAKREGIEVTDLGFAIINSMRTFVASIISVDLTRAMEQKLDKIEKGLEDSTIVIEQSVDRLLESLSEFIEKEIDIGNNIDEAVATDTVKALTIGRCPVCKEGELRIIRSHTSKKRFAGCSNYSIGKCKASAPLPQKGNIKISGKACPACDWPIIGILFAPRSRQWKICINLQCPLRKKNKDDNKE